MDVRLGQALHRQWAGPSFLSPACPHPSEYPAILGPPAMPHPHPSSLKVVDDMCHAPFFIILDLPTSATTIIFLAIILTMSPLYWKPSTASFVFCYTKFKLQRAFKTLFLPAYLLLFLTLSPWSPPLLSTTTVAFSSWNCPVLCLMLLLTGKISFLN